MAAPRHRHQPSLEGILDLINPPQIPLESGLRDRAITTCLRICTYFVDNEGPVECYSCSKLVLGTYQHIPSNVPRDPFLRIFFAAVNLEMDVDDNTYVLKEIRPLFFAFAEFLFDYLFLPCKSLP